MKKFTKVMLIMAAVCFLLGIVMTASAAMFWNGVPEVFPRDNSLASRLYYSVAEHRVNTPEEAFVTPEEQVIPPETSGYSDDPAAIGPGGARPQETKEASEEGIWYWELDLSNALEVTAEVGAVEVIEGDIPENRVVLVSMTEQMDWKEKNDDGTLELTFQSKQKSPGVIWQDQKAVLMIPRDKEFTKLQLEAKVGDLFAEHVSARELELSAETGSVEVSGNAGKLWTDAEMGTVVFDGKVKEFLSADCEMGTIELALDGKKEDFRYTLECEMGSMIIDDRDYSSMEHGYKISNKDAVKQAELGCEMGTIELRFE